MALVKCGDCGNEVSSRAPSCPKCGAPVASQQESQAAGAQLNTIQETSKKFKAQTLLSVVAMLVGVSLMVSAPDTTNVEAGAGLSMWGGLLLFGGLVWYLVTRFRIWWHHK